MTVMVTRKQLVVDNTGEEGEGFGLGFLFFFRRPSSFLFRVAEEEGNVVQSVSAFFLAYRTLLLLSCSWSLSMGSEEFGVNLFIRREMNGCLRTKMAKISLVIGMVTSLWASILR